ncbi:MAG: hypothetical protein CVT48_05300 [Thermoplasmata archaeon HGW-Thermoplasmata-1]|nr:MAG: hypothetical protein CVT48_05300 [Thermoplasmata archaeon HGW-Thermoplasmata-1]
MKTSKIDKTDNNKHSPFWGAAGILALLLSLCFVLGAFAGCIGGDSGEADDGEAENGESSPQENGDENPYPNAGTGKLGVLVAAHGMPGDWNVRLNLWAEEISLPVPVELGFLEYSPEQTIDGAVQKLEDAGATEIAAILLMINTNSSHTHEMTEALENATEKTPIYCATLGMDNDTETIDSIISRGLTLCKGEPGPLHPTNTEVAPKEATLIFVMHGDCEPWFKNWEALGESLKSGIAERGIFKEVSFCFKYEGKLGGAIDSASGHPLVVPHFI